MQICYAELVPVISSNNTINMSTDIPYGGTYKNKLLHSYNEFIFTVGDMKKIQIGHV